MASSDSSDAEDVHQCGRCKELFTDVELYFEHKKTKSCAKVKKHSLASLSLDANPNASAQKNGQKTLSLTPRNDSDRSLPPDAEEGNAPAETEVIAPAKKRRAAREILKDVVSGSDTSFENLADAKTSDQEARPKSSKRRHTAKNFKKAWAENYQDFQEKSHEKRKYEKRNDSSVPVKKRAVSSNDIDDKVTSVVEKQRGTEMTNTPPRKNNRFKFPLKTYSKPPMNRLSVSPISTSKVDEDTTASTDDIRPNNSTSNVTNFKFLGSIVENDSTKRPAVRKSNRKPKPKYKEGSYSPKRTSQGVDEPGQSSRQYQCSTCDYTTHNKNEFVYHLQFAHEFVGNDCPLCQASFPNSQSLVNHMLSSCSEVCIEHPSKLYPYPRDQYKMQRKSYMEKHRNLLFKVHVPLNQNEIDLDVDTTEDEGQHGMLCVSFRCKTCGEILNSYAGILSHLKEHNNVNYSICRYCGKWFSSQYKLFKHLCSNVHNHLNEDKMEKIKQRLSTLNIHDRDFKDSVAGKEICLLCKGTFSTLGQFDMHVLKRHTPLTLVYRYRCGQCTESLPGIAEFIKHYKSVHTDSEHQRGEYQCPVCKWHFTQSSLCQKHRETVHEPRQQVPISTTSEHSGNSKDVPNQEIVERSCFVCKHVSDSEQAYEKHMLLHKVWAPHPELGTNPTELFEDVKNPRTTNWVTKINVQLPSSRTKSTDQNNSLHTVTDREDSPNYTEMIEGENYTHPQFAVTVLQKFADTVSLSSDCVQEERDEEGNVRLIRNLSKVKRNKVSEILTGKETGTNTPSTSQENTPINDKSPETLPDCQTRQYSTSLSNDPLVCQFCLKVCNSLEEVYAHKKRDHQLIDVYRCIKKSCMETFEDLLSYREHSAVHPQISFICSYCNLHVDDLSDINFHKTVSHRMHTSDRFSCTVCNKNFSTNKSLMKHITELNHKPCKICLRIFKTQEELSNHMEVHSGEKRYLCDQCGAVFTCRNSLSRHRLIHKERRYECEKCGQKFNKGEHLRRHFDAKHTTEKPFKCAHPGCDSAFKRKDKLKDHMKKHTKVKPFACEICGRSYGYREGLRYHIEKTHQVEGKYACTECGVTFTRPSMLQQHMTKQHEVKRSKSHLYPCTKCAKCFHRPERLNRHIERDHKSDVEWKIKCTHCNKGFQGQKSLDTHVRKIHGAQKKKRLSKVERFMQEAQSGKKVKSETSEPNDLLKNSDRSPVKEERQQKHQDLMQQAMNETFITDETPLNQFSVANQIDIPIENNVIATMPQEPVILNEQIGVTNHPHTVQWTPQGNNQTLQAILQNTLPIKQLPSTSNESFIKTSYVNILPRPDPNVSTVSLPFMTSQSSEQIVDQQALITQSNQTKETTTSNLIILTDLLNQNQVDVSSSANVPLQTLDTRTKHNVGPPRKQRILSYLDQNPQQFVNNAPASNVLGNVLQFCTSDVPSQNNSQTNTNFASTTSHQISPISTEIRQPLTTSNMAANNGAVEATNQFQDNWISGVTDNKVQGEPGEFIPRGPLPPDMKNAHLLIQLHNEARKNQEEKLNQRNRQLRPQQRDGKQKYANAPLSYNKLNVSGENNEGSNTSGLANIDTALDKTRPVLESLPAKDAKDILAEILVQNMVPGSATAMKFGLTNKAYGREKNEEAVASPSEQTETYQSNHLLDQNDVFMPVMETPIGAQNIQYKEDLLRAQLNTTQKQLEYIPGTQQILMSTGANTSYILSSIPNVATTSENTTLSERVTAQPTQQIFHEVARRTENNERPTDVVLQLPLIFPQEKPNRLHDEESLSLPRKGKRGKKHKAVLSHYEENPLDTGYPENTRVIKLPSVIFGPDSTSTFDSNFGPHVSGPSPVSELQYDTTRPPDDSRHQVSPPIFQDQFHSTSGNAPLESQVQISMGQQSQEMGLQQGKPVFAGQPSQNFPDMIIDNFTDQCPSNNFIPAETQADFQCNNIVNNVVTIPETVSTVGMPPVYIMQAPELSSAGNVSLAYATGKYRHILPATSSKHTPSILSRNMTVPGSPTKYMSKEMTSALYQQLLGQGQQVMGGHGQ